MEGEVCLDGRRSRAALAALACWPRARRDVAHTVLLLLRPRGTRDVKVQVQAASIGAREDCVRMRASAPRTPESCFLLRDTLRDTIVGRARAFRKVRAAPHRA